MEHLRRTWIEQEASDRIGKRLRNQSLFLILFFRFFNGTSATEFVPKSTCTNAHVVTFLHRAEDEPAAKGESALAAGYPENAWYGNAVAWADTSELLAGTGSDFVATENSPRANIVTYLYRNAK